MFYWSSLLQKDENESDFHNILQKYKKYTDDIFIGFIRFLKLVITYDFTTFWPKTVHFHQTKQYRATFHCDFYACTIFLQLRLETLSPIL